MDWEHKGVKFTITTEKAGSFTMASARTPREGIFVRVRPFSALGKSEEEALELLKQQIKMEFRRLPG